MCYFFQWVYWRTADPENDALRGHHDKSQPPIFDLLKELGKLRQRTRAKLGEEALADEDWLAASEKSMFTDLPRPQLQQRVRLSAKTAPPSPKLGARERKEAYGGCARKRKAAKT